jgi:branched-chain amino acid transport system ATP-binding protein
MSILLETKGLTKEFRGFVAVRSVDLTIERGAIHALIGPNGAGKTTVFNLLTKFLKPTAGRILYESRDVTSLAPAAIARMGVVRSFQISATFPQMTALENVRVALAARAGGSFAFWRSDRSLERHDRRAQELLEDVNLTAFAAARAGELSYGRKRALEIATTLALEPDLLLLDEPMAGMAHEEIQRIAQLIKRIAVGRTVLMVEHNLGVVADLCDRITVLRAGEILAEGDYATVSKDPRVIEAYMGTGQ